MTDDDCLTNTLDIETLGAALDRRRLRLDLRADGFHVQHRRDRNGRWTRQAAWCDAEAPVFPTLAAVGAYLAAVPAKPWTLATRAPEVRP